MLKPVSDYIVSFRIAPNRSLLKMYTVPESYRMKLDAYQIIFWGTDAHL